MFAVYNFISSFLNDFVYYFVKKSLAQSSIFRICRKVCTLILDWGFRSFYFGAQLLIGLVIPATIFFGEKHRFNWQDKTEKQYFFIVYHSLLLLPCQPMPFNHCLALHQEETILAIVLLIVWTSFIVVEIIAIYNIFKNKDYQTRYELCVFLCIQLFMHYNSTYIMGFTFKSCLFNCVILQHTFS